METMIKADEARGSVSKLDGITHKLPSTDFFLNMFVAKDATSSAQIEGTKATMAEALGAKVGLEVDDSDADDILYYIKAFKYGIDRLKNFPFSLRFIKELHKKLMTGARFTQYPNPGDFRVSQNWIGGTNPLNASFVPPPVIDMRRALGDFEEFLHNKKATLPLIHIALMHAHFETIHPFLDGNGRTGRLLVTMMLINRGLLESPVLFLSSYFKKHQKIYYQKLNNYHEGEVEAWVNFFLDGIIEISNKSINICKNITELYEEDMCKLRSLGKRESESGVKVLKKLYGQPIISSKIIMEWTGYTRSGADRVIYRFIDLGILQLLDENEIYDKSYSYKKYIDLFLNN
ncbi:MAG: Fic family protein [Candidatus Magasanikbacteria bacterium]|nr:Fic family protein [Candidatus Magasanikbacteria bacterium]